VSKRNLAVAGVGLIGIAGLARRLRRRKTGDA
jgi:MYXO-CTERM domain-containing protein